MTHRSVDWEVGKGGEGKGKSLLYFNQGNNLVGSGS